MMDRPLKVRRNPTWLKFRRHLISAVVLFAIVFCIGALPPTFLYLSGYLSKNKDLQSGNNALSGGANSATPIKDKVIAFVDVNVIPMDSERVIAGQTVIVKDGKIERIGPAKDLKIPKEALRIDAKGKYLIPGLADMHVHLRLYNEDLNNSLFQLFLANGVTTILNLYGTPNHLELREKVASGEILGPTIYSSGPFISDAPSPSPSVEEVEREVIEQKRAGYDIIKIHGDFSREAYHKLFEVARREGIKVIGHAPRNLGAEAMIEEKQDAVAHSEEYLYSYFFKQQKPLKNADEEIKNRFMAEQVEKIPGLAEAIAKAGTWVVPNLTAYKTIGLQVADIDSVLSRPEVKYVPVQIFNDWIPENNTYVRRFKGEENKWFFRTQYGLLEKLVKGFKEAGVRMLAGTDTPIPSVVPGFSIHDELRDLVAAGLTPYESLKAATSNPAEFLGALDQVGTVSVGKRADLILLEGNPLEDIRNTSRQSGVMVRGRWIPDEEIRRMLDNLKN
jgi:imidazolonepropionase-like amidohydrolase